MYILVTGLDIPIDMYQPLIDMYNPSIIPITTTYLNHNKFKTYDDVKKDIIHRLISIIKCNPNDSQKITFISHSIGSKILFDLYHEKYLEQVRVQTCRCIPVQIIAIEPMMINQDIYQKLQTYNKNKNITKSNVCKFMKDIIFIPENFIVSLCPDVNVNININIIVHQYMNPKTGCIHNKRPNNIMSYFHHISDNNKHIFQTKNKKILHQPILNYERLVLIIDNNKEFIIDN
jgi:hypothetical protein